MLFILSALKNNLVQLTLLLSPIKSELSWLGDAVRQPQLTQPIDGQSWDSSPVCLEAEPILKFKVSFLVILNSSCGGSRRNSLSLMGLKLRSCLSQREVGGGSGLQGSPRDKSDSKVSPTPPPQLAAVWVARIMLEALLDWISPSCSLWLRLPLPGVKDEFPMYRRKWP